KTSSDHVPLDPEFRRCSDREVWLVSKLLIRDDTKPWEAPGKELERDLRFSTSKGRASAIVRSSAEGQMIGEVVPHSIEGARIYEMRFVPTCGAIKQIYPCPSRKTHCLDLNGFFGSAQETVTRTVDAHGLFQVLVNE